MSYLPSHGQCQTSKYVKEQRKLKNVKDKKNISGEFIEQKI